MVSVRNGLPVAQEVRRVEPQRVETLKELERENSYLKKPVAELGQADPSGRPAAKTLKPARNRELLFELREDYWISERGACRLLVLHRSVSRYKPRKKDDRAQGMRLEGLAYSRLRCGYRRLTVCCSAKAGL